MINMSNLEKSPNWDNVKDSQGFIEEGFPFNEGFPQRASAYGDSEYTLVFRDGTRLTGYPDYSRMYMAEGVEWKIKQPSSFRGLAQHVIAAWCENPEQSTDT